MSAVRYHHHHHHFARWLKPQLFNIPTLVVAIRSGGSMDNQLMEEGQEYAEKNGYMFMTSEHWKGEGSKVTW